MNQDTKRLLSSAAWGFLGGTSLSFGLPLSFGIGTLFGAGKAIGTIFSGLANNPASPPPNASVLMDAAAQGAAIGGTIAFIGAVITIAAAVTCIRKAPSKPAALIAGLVTMGIWNYGDTPDPADQKPDTTKETPTYVTERKQHPLMRHRSALAPTEPSDDSNSPDGGTTSIHSTEITYRIKAGSAANRLTEKNRIITNAKGITVSYTHNEREITIECNNNGTQSTRSQTCQPPTETVEQFCGILRENPADPQKFALGRSMIQRACGW